MTTLPEFGKIICERDKGGTLTATAYLSAELGGAIPIAKIRQAKRRLEKSQGSQLRDFASTRMDGSTPYYALSVCLGIYATEWDEMRELIRFREVVEGFSKSAYCIDCSPLASQQANRR